MELELFNEMGFQNNFNHRKKILKPLISYPGNLVYMVMQWLLVAPG